MCEFSESGDIGSDISVDIESESGTDIDVETIEVEDIPEDIDDYSLETSDTDVFEDSFNDEIEEIPEDVEDNVTEINGYTYTSDSEGRVSEVEGDLRLEEGSRDSSAQLEAGGEYRRDTDDGGHFIGNRFDGPGSDINMFAQDSNFNRGGYKSMENEWARELDKGKDVHVKIDPIYQEGTERPHAVMGEYTVTENGEKTTEYFSHTNENLRSDEFNIDDYDFEFPEEKN